MDQTNPKLVQNPWASALTQSTSFDHSAAVRRSLHWNPLKCSIHFKELLLFSKVLNGKLESLSNLLFAPSHQCKITVRGFIGLPPLHLDSNPIAFCWCATHLVFRNLN